MSSITARLYNKIGRIVIISSPIRYLGITIHEGTYVIIGSRESSSVQDSVIIMRKDEFNEQLHNINTMDFSLTSGIIVPYDSIYPYISRQEKIDLSEYGTIGVDCQYLIFSKNKNQLENYAINYTYEYTVKTFEFDSSKTLESMLNNMGNKGWELSVTDTVGNNPIYVFKRKKYNNNYKL